MSTNAIEMLPFEVLAFGRFRRAQLIVTKTADERPTSVGLEEAIAAEWTKRVAQAAKTGAVLFNGDLFRYVSHRVIAANERDSLELMVGPTCYRDFVGTNLYNSHRIAEFGWERFANPIGTTATIFSGDGHICYGRRSQRVAFHAGHVHTVGGTLEASDTATDGSVDPFGSVLRELKEELNLEPHELDEFVCVGLIRDTQICQPELLFEGRTKLTAQELEQRWRTAESRDEHDEIVVIKTTPENLVPFMKSCGPIAPVAVGALFLYGMGRWGRSWFEDAARQFVAERI